MGVEDPGTATGGGLRKGIEDKSRIVTWPTPIETAARVCCAALSPARFPPLSGCLPAMSGDRALPWDDSSRRAASPAFGTCWRVPVVWDAFLSLYSTVVEDRRLTKPPASIWHRALKWWEWLTCRAADLVLLDTRVHADYFVRVLHAPEERTAVVFVGAETELFSP